MNKKILLVSVLLASCASTNNDSLYNKGLIDDNTSYFVNDIKVDLQQRCVEENKGFYPDAKELSKIYTESFKNKFCSEKKCVNTVNNNTVKLNIKINQFRVMMGEGFACNKHFGSNRYDYVLTATKNINGVEKEIFEETKTNLNVNMGLFANLSKIFSQITFSGDRETEFKEVSAFSSALAKEVVSRIFN